MAKQIILYNLAPHITDKQYQDYVIQEKCPLLESLSSVKKFELIRVNANPSEPAPYQYVGIMHLSSLEEFYQNDAPSAKFGEFM